MRVLPVGDIPFGKRGDFFERRMWNLCGEQTKKRLAGLVVNLRIFADEIQRGKGVNIIAVRSIRVFRMILGTTVKEVSGIQCSHSEW